MLAKLRALFMRKRIRQDLKDEAAEHFQMEVDAHAARGVPPDKARELVRQSFGNRTRIEESAQEAWAFRWLEGFFQDLRHALRTLRRRPGFALTAIFLLALGIGANTAMFGLVDSLMLETMTSARPQDLVKITEGEPGPAYRETLAYPAYDALRRNTALLRDLALMSILNPRPAEIQEHGEPAEAYVQWVSDNFFDVLGVQPARGRLFREGTSSGEPVAVISHAFWLQHFSQDASAIGARFRYLNREFTVAGIAAPEFHGSEFDSPTDIWVPILQAIPASDDTYTRGRLFHLMARVPREARARARAEAAAAFQAPITIQETAVGYSQLRNRLGRPLLLLQFVAALVLLIACVNLANLMLARAASREREIAARWSLGASKARLVRSLFAESLVLSSAGGSLALAVAYWINGALLRFLPADQARALANLRFEPDLWILGFTGLLSAITCVLFGLVPAIQAVRRSGSLAVRWGAGVQRNRSWTGRSLIAGEIAVCTLLLMIAGVFVRSVQNLRGQDSGYREDQLLIADIDFPRGYPEERRDQEIEDLRVRSGSLPGVEAAAFSHLGQLSGGGIEYRIQVPGRETPRGDIVFEQRISPRFFAAMGARILAGREFTEQDQATSLPVAIVNPAFAAKYLPPGNPIGQRFFQEGGSRAGELMEVVGVVQDSKWINLRADSPPMYYRPYTQKAGYPVARFAIRAKGDLDALAAQFRQTAAAIDPQMILRSVTPFTEVVNRSLLTERLVSQVSTGGGVLALLIAAVGLYGVLAYGVTRRRREIGVRIAVGASPGSVEWMILRESLVLLAAGVVLGVPAGALVTRLVSSLLFGVGPHDPATIAAILGVLAVSTLAASYWPARRAAQVNPVATLRED